MTTSIPDRFNGPPHSANGGYACGTAAAHLPGDGPAQVSLHAPPPLGVALEVDTNPSGVTLRGPDGPIASAEAWTGEVDVPAAVPFDEAARVRDGFDVDEYRSGHIFPTCFACGPDRDAHDGLCLFAGRHPTRDMVVWPWTPHQSLVAEDGLVDPPVLWAALDCPSGLPWTFADEPEAIVLGRLATQIERRPAPGEPLVVAGWPIGREGRRRMSGSVVWSADGEVVACAEATWVALSAEQAAAFAASTRS